MSFDFSQTQRDKISAWVLDVIFPPRCVACRAFGPDLFCETCRTTLQPIRAPFCRRCGAPFDPLAQAHECADCHANRYHGAPPFDAIRSGFAFTGALRPAVHQLKYKGKIALAPRLAPLLWQTWQSDDVLKQQNFALLCPVPLHSWRRWRRGYNQSALLAANLSKLSGVPCGDVLIRTRRTPPQVGLNEKERLQNMRGAFEVDKSALRHHNPAHGAILLIDDVCTTGATLAECARVLKTANVAPVCGLTLARQL